MYNKPKAFLTFATKKYLLLTLISKTMKKLFSLALVCSVLFIGTANAQTETYYGGKKGSFAITVGADPVINYVGNMFNGTQDNSLSNLGGTLAVKWYTGNQFALKAGLGFNNYKYTDFEYNPEDDDYKEIISKKTEGSRNFLLSIGAEYHFRPGRRMQPFIGADIFCGRENEYTVSKDYDAKYEEEDRWGDSYEVRQYDAIAKNSEPINTFGAVVNLGVECFLSKNISISAALDLGVKSSTYKTISKFETDDRDISNKEIEALNYKIKTGRSTVFATGLMNGNIAFNFYF